MGGDYIIIKTWKNGEIGGLDFARFFPTSVGLLQLKQKLSNLKLSNFSFYDSFYDLFYQIYRFLQPIVNRELREMTYYLFYLTTRRVKIIIYYHTI